MSNSETNFQSFIRFIEWVIGLLIFGVVIWFFLIILNFKAISESPIDVSKMKQLNEISVKTKGTEFETIWATKIHESLSSENSISQNEFKVLMEFYENYKTVKAADAKLGTQYILHAQKELKESEPFKVEGSERFINILVCMGIILIMSCLAVAGYHHANR